MKVSAQGKEILSLKYMQGNCLFFSLEPHKMFMWTSALEFSHELMSRAVCVLMAVRVCALYKRKVCSSHSFSRELHIPFFLNQLVSRALALASCIVVSRLQGRGCCSVRFLETTSVPSLAC